MKKIISFGSIALLAPMFAFAATNALNIVGALQFLLNAIIPALITLGVVYFIWGIISYIISSDEEAKKGARDHIIKGLIGLFVIFAFWGIIAIVRNTLGVTNDQGPSTGTLVPCNIPLGITQNCYQ